jgi:Phage integrase family.
MEALKLIPEYQENTIITNKDYINHFRSSEPKRNVLFTDFIELTVEKKKKRSTESYQRQYATIIAHLNNFCDENNCVLYTNSINEEFLDDFIIYLEDKDLRINTIKGVIEKVKAMTRKASIYGYMIDPSYEEISVKEEESFSIYLSMNDITRIYYFKGLSKKKERIRDLFIIGCLTALRYSDYSTLTPDNFQDGFIVKLTKKTKTKVRIPMHDYIKAIYAKYNGDVPGGLCIQYFNKYIKIIAKEIGFNEKLVFNYTKGGELVTETKEKWEMVSSHTARRSAATNLYLTGRMKTYEIMQLTGHTTEKNFFRYIKITNEDASRSIAGDNFFRI